MACRWLAKSYILRTYVVCHAKGTQYRLPGEVNRKTGYVDGVHDQTLSNRPNRATPIVLDVLGPSALVCFLCLYSSAINVVFQPQYCERLDICDVMLWPELIFKGLALCRVV